MSDSASGSGRPTPSLSMVLLLGGLTAFGPLSIDMYLPAFPAVAADLGASIAAVERTLAAFFIGMAVGQILYGPLADRFGRRAPLLCGCGLYTLASVCCALAPDVHTLLFARLAQALGGAAGIVVVRAVVRDLYAVDDSARIYSRLLLVVGVAPILAPLAGSALLTALGWRAIFWVLTGFGAIAFLATWRLLPESHAGTPGAAHPLNALATFRAVVGDPSFAAPAAATALSLGTMFAYITGSPDTLINHFHVSPPMYALVFGANAAGYILCSQINARLVRGQGAARLLRSGLMGLCLVSALQIVCSFTGLGGAASIIGLWFLQLSALGFVGANSTALAMFSQGRRAGSAAALLGAAQFACAGLAGSALSIARAVGGSAQAIALVVALGAFLALATRPWRGRLA